MAKINQELLDRLAMKLGVGKTRVYALIQDISHKNHVERHHGALLLAGDNGISRQKYATPEEMKELRGLGNHISVAAPANDGAVAQSATRRPAAQKSKKSTKVKENTVFVVHGRDRKLRDAMYTFLGALGLKPQEWGHALRAARGANPFINDAVNKIMERAQAIVVLLSPDDEAKLKDQFVGKDERTTEGKLRGQARPNVLFETGIALGAFHKKTVLVRVGDVKSFTDLDGMHILRLTGDDTSRHEFVNRLKTLNCKIELPGDHWLRAGDFTPTGPKVAKPKKSGRKR